MSNNCNIIQIFFVTLDQFSTSLLNDVTLYAKNITNFLTVVYFFLITMIFNNHHNNMHLHIV